ncbi:MAG: ABC transporter permease [Bacteroidetes bacterium]|nr:ABC transporter permease [Bacteroidota bacterium]MBS1539086.1 ABC transporter permease [Bacteroidota bacterium]
MNLSLFIARRYFLSKRKRNFINIISGLSIVAIAFSTAALVIVLSVFNGLEGLLRTLNSAFDPEIKIEAAKGKTFEATHELLSKIESVTGVAIATEVLEDYGYVRYRDADMVVTMKGVGDNFIDQHRIDPSIVDGKLKLRDSLGQYAILGKGIQYQLSVSVNESIYPLQVFYIKNGKTTIDPTKLYSVSAIQPGGVFSIEKNFDENYVLLPIDFVRHLTGYHNRCTSLEIKTTSGSNIQKIKNAIQQQLGNDFVVLTNDEQHQELYKLVKIEKLFTFISMGLLAAIASINIFFSLMMLAIEKKKDISIFFAMGAQKSTIKNIFLKEGALIAGSGAMAGLLLGALVCWAQDQFGLVSMGMESAIVNAYPVKMKLVDFASIGSVMIVITFLTSFYPALLASRSYSANQL